MATKKKYKLPKAWCVVFCEAEDGTMWFVRNHRDGEQTWLRPAGEDWTQAVKALTI